MPKLMRDGKTPVDVDAGDWFGRYLRVIAEDGRRIGYVTALNLNGRVAECAGQEVGLSSRERVYLPFARLALFEMPEHARTRLQATRPDVWEAIDHGLSASEVPR